jgi:type VII secretion-associated serine protease mycosin
MRRWSRGAAGAFTALLMVMSASTPGFAATYPKPLDQQWWFAAWAVQDKVWPVAQGKGVTVAVLDTGVEAGIPELAGVVVPGTDAETGNGDGSTDRDDAPVPGHGTGMASLIAAQGKGTGFVGVAPGARILPVIAQSGEAYTKGIRFAVDHGAKVINLSQAVASACPEGLQQAVSYAIEHDVVIVAGAGNNGDSPNASMYPANCVGVLAVGAVDNKTNPWAKTERQPYVTVAAPGVQVGSVLKDGQYYSSNGGTSGASALTSAAVALVRSKHPQMSAREVVQRIIASARDVGPAGKDNQTGYGAVRPQHALSDNVPKSAPNPVFDAYDKWAAANGKGGSTGKTGAQSSGSGGTDWGKIALYVMGMMLVPIAIVIILLIMRRKNKRRPQFPATGQQGGMPPSFGGPYPPQPGETPAPPGARPHFLPPEASPQHGAMPPSQGSAGPEA